jgi:quercetin dioxygenase-like cupin family protein
LQEASHEHAHDAAVHGPRPRRRPAGCIRPRRDLIFKVTGEETGGAVDYLIVEVAPCGGPPMHVHHTQDELIHAAKGRFKVQIGEETFVIEEGGFAYLPRGIQHAFLNLTDEPAELNMVFTPGGTHKFFEELAPVARAANPDRAAIAAVFEKHDMSLLGPPLTAD